MRIILLGAPGSGKGTQARKLVERYKVPQISTGDILRAAVQDGSDAGKKAEQIMNDGGLVPDALVIELVSERVIKSDSRRGFILDGFPRNIPQAQELDTRLGWVSRPLQMAINFEVDQDKLVKRITGRRTCDDCGAIYNIHFNTPKKRGICDSCGGTLSLRDDDTAAAAKTRLDTYHQETELLVQYYRAQHKLRTLIAEGDPDVIFEHLCEMIDTEIRPLENKIVSIHSVGETSTTHTQIAGGKIVREVTGLDSRTTRVQLRQAGEETELVNHSKTAGSSRALKSSTGKKKPAKTTAITKPKSTPEATAKAKTAEPGKSVKKKVAVKTSVAKKAVTKKTPVKKVTAKKSVAKKAAKKVSKKKTPAKKVASKSASKKIPTKKATTGKSVTKKVVSKQARKKKVVTKKPVAKKPIAKKAASKKVTTKKKGVAKKAGSKKTVQKKTPRKR